MTWKGVLVHWGQKNFRGPKLRDSDKSCVAVYIMFGKDFSLCISNIGKRLVIYNLQYFEMKKLTVMIS